LHGLKPTKATRRADQNRHPCEQGNPNKNSALSLALSFFATHGLPSEITSSTNPLLVEVRGGLFVVPR
jgi:hypothetical protein